MRLSFVAIFLSYVDCAFNQLLLVMIMGWRRCLWLEKAPAAERDEPYDDFVMAPTNDLLFVLNAQYQLNEVASKLSRPGYWPMMMTGQLCCSSSASPSVRRLPYSMR